MMNKLYTVLFRKLARRESTRFNGRSWTKGGTTRSSPCIRPA